MPERPFQSHNHARPEDVVYKFVRLRVGGSHHLNVAGTGTTPTIAEYIPPKDFMFVRMTVHSQNNDISPDSFFGLAGLTNGMRLAICDEDDNELLDFLDGETLTVQDDMSLLAGTDVHHNQQGAGQADSVIMRWTIEGMGKKLWLRPGEKFCVFIQDDLTEIDDLHFMVQGYFANP